MAASMPVSVLLRDGPHASATVRLGLKAEQFAINIAKTPIQIPIPQQSPELIDLGIFRPSITVSGLVDNEPEDVANTSNSPAGTRGMPSFVYAGQTYYFPYKNKLEEAAYKWITSTTTDLELEIGDAGTPMGSNHTGGGVYKVAIQQARFQVDAAREDRWTFAMQFVCKSRQDVTFS